MKKLSVVTFIILGLASLLAACGTAEEEPRVQPTEGKLTFVFFYTDG
ncbi:MAG: hypothetical protein GWN14_01560 [candidate division Zixibacteria bacterium]|nr:hypothetical protein [Gammaproteobacteria bacterium]NIX54646.1 hypothetical protein [candidate division Zixibacteria bacterium]